LNKLGFNDVRQTDNRHSRNTSAWRRAFEVDLSVEKLKHHRSPGIDQISTELIKTGSRKIRSEIHKLIISIWNKEELPEEWKQSIVVAIYRKGDKTDCSNYRGITLLPSTYKIVSNILL